MLERDLVADNIEHIFARVYIFAVSSSNLENASHSLWFFVKSLNQIWRSRENVVSRKYNDNIKGYGER